MTDDKIVDEITSQPLNSNSDESQESTVDEMLSQFEEEVKGGEGVENPKFYESDCKGNIMTPCIREGLEELEDAAETTDVDYTVIGGIATQLRGLADCADILIIGDQFGRRQTSDIDVLVNSHEDGVSLQDEYDDFGKPNLDYVEGHIPGDQQIIEDSETIDYSQIVSDFNFELRIPNNEDLVYSKVWHPGLEEKEGTRYDLSMHAQHSGYIFDLDEPRLRELIKERAPNQEASIDYLIRAGIDI